MSTEALGLERGDRAHILSVEDVTVEFDMERGVSTVLDGALSTSNARIVGIFQDAHVNSHHVLGVDLV